MVEEDFIERYVIGNEGDLEDPEIQKLWIKYGLTDVLIDTVDLFSDNEVIEKILANDLWQNKRYILKRGKIESINLLKGEELVEHLYEVSINFVDENENKFTMKGLCDKDKLSKYINQPISVIADKEENKKLRFCCFLKEAQKLTINDEFQSKEGGVEELTFEDLKDCVFGEESDPICFCSIIGVDNFGNDIIDRFQKIEKLRHSEERIAYYKENYELIQFVKIKENQNGIIKVIDFDKEIYPEDLKSVIVLIGEKENFLSRQIKLEYEDNCIIEIYTEDVEEYKFKLITTDIHKIIDLLRIIAYTDCMPYYVMSNIYQGLSYMRALLLEDIKKGEIATYKYEGTLQEINKKIKEIPPDFIDEKCIIHIIGNDELDEYSCHRLASKLYKKELFTEDVGYISAHICDIDKIEIMVMKTVS